MPAPVGELMEYDAADAADEKEQEEVIASGDCGTVLEVKHLDEVYDMMTGFWSVKPTPESVTKNKHASGGKYDAYAFTVIRKFNPAGMTPDGKAPAFNMTKLLEIHSEQLRKVGTEVIGQVQGISWTAKPLRVEPQVLLGWLPELEAYQEKLSSKLDPAAPDSLNHLTHAHLSHLVGWLRSTYAATLASLASLLEHNEISFDLLWAIYVPGKTTLQVPCPTSSEPRAVRLIHAEKCQKSNGPGGTSAAYDPSGLTIGTGSASEQSKYLWRLVVEYVDADLPAGSKNEPGLGTSSEIPLPSGTGRFGFAGLGTVLDIPGFAGTKKIATLGIYPLQYYAGPDGPEGLRQRLIDRGRKWAKLACGVHHLAYQGIAYHWRKPEYIKSNVNSRVMIDRKTFIDTVPNYERFLTVTKTLAGVEIDRHALRVNGVTTDQEQLVKVEDLSDDILMLTTPLLYGFSLADKRWLEFVVDFVEPFEWNDEAYVNLVMPAEQKMLLTTLVEAHTATLATKFDDFVEGKGLGLVINLFGNPGTGKSLTAEAMSEYLRKPLYVIGAGDLGTTAEKVDAILTIILKVSACWGAVVLIDEADVFLEERSLQFLERNAMVAVFLRHLEYFRGILFLTTNRVRVFDEAFQSRIHVSLRYHDLTADARLKIWVAFLRKLRLDAPDGGLTKDELRDLSEKRINGRQIKNVVKTAGALASGKNEVLGFSHLMQVLNMMDQFDGSHAMYQ